MLAGCGDRSGTGGHGLSLADWKAEQAWEASQVFAASIGMPQGSFSGGKWTVKNGTPQFVPTFNNAAFVAGGASYFTGTISSTLMANGMRAIGIIDIDFGGEVFSGGEGAQCWRAMQ